MTAAAVEDDEDQAGEPELSPREKHLAEWLEAMTAADKLLRLVIADELAEDLPALEQAQAKAAAALEEAYAALVGPEHDLAELDAEIAGADADRARWEAVIADKKVPREKRAVARFQHAECESDLASLRQRREFAEAQLLPHRDAHAKARTALDAATGALEGRKLNATPALAYYGAGQKTSAYSFRFGMPLEGILRDRDHYEHDAAVEHMLWLCAASGFRTENYPDRLPSDAEMARRYWDSVHDAAMNRAVSDPVPTAMDLKMQTAVEMENNALQQLAARNVIDDRRPAYAQPVPDRPYMQWDSPLRDSRAG